MSCIKFHTSYGLVEPATSETEKPLKLQSLKSLSLAANMGTIITKITKDNQDVVFHAFFENKDLQEKWSKLCSSGHYHQCMGNLARLIEDNKLTLGILDGNGYAPIHYVAQNLNLKDPHVIDLFEKLLDYSKAYVNLFSEPRDLEPGNTPLHLAAGYNNNPVITTLLLLINKRTDVNQENEDCNTPLQLAAMHNHNPEIISILRAKSPKVNHKDIYRNNLLHLAARCNDSPTVIQELAASGVGINQKIVKDGLLYM
ncbi:MAG: ankyrin repeat domain-containing protein [Candidatus Cardinium sp.]|uniref:ankyrin repeat domain-containing protein n=1 Tax=Cardinium endosymbiont of Dermatophagoides farinae TaxID=2597823 RepID=UPI001643369D|nr:ankyrin repeat domain-containing protein [Cardinium endosymbiont of Dermatophagoides farinae]UWW96428.1 MAG: ankyrin repeat domain-containing protein [Candidatus Cardinium sp.]